eukprot:7954382-Pyramimonas_sp.AAC.1
MRCSNRDTRWNYDQQLRRASSLVDAVLACQIYSDREGALNNDTAKAALKTQSVELRIRARGQRATAIDAGNGILRHLIPWRLNSVS